VNVTGHITITRTPDGLRYEWQGGDMISISRELLEDAEDGVFSTRSPQIGERFTIGPFHVICSGKEEPAGVVYAYRDLAMEAQS
jgi:hypothetical protein